ncbi:MAG: glycosyltransferase, partial [Lentisphaerae bacterium]|nr:glycosyltransferase [Lentisphaerota bacterium]
LDFIRAESRAKCLYYGHDLHHLRQRRKYELDRNPETLKDAEEWKTLEYDIFSKVDVVYYPSPVEVAECLKAFPNRVVRAIPAYIFDEFPDQRAVPFARTRDLLFVGGFGHPPNEDAVVWFVEQVFPEIRRRLPDVRFIVAGANPPDSVKRFQSEAVSILGHVPDDELDALYRQCRLAVVPLRYGAGVKGKVVEALVRRLPVVTTSVGAEGLDGAESALCVAADAAAFAARVAGLYADEPALERLAENGMAYVKGHFSRVQALQALSADIDFSPR